MSFGFQEEHGVFRLSAAEFVAKEGVRAFLAKRAPTFGKK